MAKVLICTNHFYPETFRCNDVAFELANRGYDVTVLTAIPDYPKGKYYDGYGIFRKRHETVNGVKVIRGFIIPRGNGGGIRLMLNYLSFLISSIFISIFLGLFRKYDKVLIHETSPVMIGIPAVIVSKIQKLPLYFWVLDLWPESLTAAGGINNKYVLGFFKHYVKSQYKHSDILLTSSRSFDKSILEYGDYKDKIVYFPQWSDGVDGALISPENAPSIPDGFKLMFAGAVGEAHGFECTMKAALLTKEHKDIKWIIVGDGRKLDWVKSFVKENGLEETVYTLGRFPSDTMPWFFNQADVMLVTLSDDPLFALYAPAKISSYMASGKPIVAVLNGEGAEVIKDADCGWSLPAGDSEGFAKLAIELSQKDKAELQAKGVNAAKYYNEHFVKEKCLRKLDDLMGLVKE